MKEKTIEKGTEKPHEKAVEKQNIIQKISANPKIMLSIYALIVIIAIAAVVYLQIEQSRIYIEKSAIDAPIITLSPDKAGILNKVYVEPGDIVGKSKALALIGNETIYAKTHGLIIDTMNTPGQFVTSSNPIIKMIDPSELRVIGTIEEDKGLKDIIPGQKVVFTVDTFDSKKYYGVVDSISPTSRESDIVFSISDKRQQKEYDVKVMFDVDAYPELKNGMSAKMWIYK